MPETDIPALLARLDELNLDRDAEDYGLFALRAWAEWVTIRAHIDTLTEELKWWEEWSNDLARLLPEDYDDDVAQEAIIERALADLVDRAERAEAELAALREGIKEMHRPGTIHPLGDDDFGLDESVVLHTYCYECTPDSSLRMIEDCEWTEDWPLVAYPCDTLALLAGGES